MKEIIYSESQRFRSTAWLYFVLLLFVFMVTLTLYGLFSQLVLNIPFGSNPMSDGGLIAVSVFTLLLPVTLLWLFWSASLEVIIATDGLYFRYVPFINKYRKIEIIAIENCEVRKYRPIMEFGGWGVRYSMKEKTICYNVRGNLGLFVVLKSGKRILFGSQDPHKLKAALDKVRGVN
jgi:hypothetical protein